MNRPIAHLVAAALFFSQLPSQADTVLYPVNSVLTDLQSIRQGKLTSKEKFDTSDVIFYFTTVTWQDVTESGGSHDVTWNWYKNNVLASSSTRSVRFRHAPFRLSTAHLAADFGPGKIRIDIVVDNKVLSTAQLRIVQ